MSENDDVSPVFGDSELRESFGDFLKRNREASGKTLDGISRSTRISKHYLQAFEENDLRAFPDEAFARGFLKTYSCEIGLDVDDCMARYDRYRRSLMPTQIRDIKKLRKPGPALTSEVLDLGRYQKVLLSLLGGGVLLAGLILVVIWGIQKIQTSPPEEKPEVARAQEAPVVETPLAASPLSTQAVTSPSATLPTPVKPSVLSIKALKDSVVSLRVDEAAVQELHMKLGETQTINIYKDVEIRAADRGAFQFQYNGKPLDISGPMIKLFNRHLFSRKP